MMTPSMEPVAKSVPSKLNATAETLSLNSDICERRGEEGEREEKVRERKGEKEGERKIIYNKWCTFTLEHLMPISDSPYVCAVILPSCDGECIAGIDRDAEDSPCA